MSEYRYSLVVKAKAIKYKKGLFHYLSPYISPQSFFIFSAEDVILPVSSPGFQLVRRHKSIILPIFSFSSSIRISMQMLYPLDFLVALQALFKSSSILVLLPSFTLLR